MRLANQNFYGIPLFSFFRPNIRFISLFEQRFIIDIEFEVKKYCMKATYLQIIITVQIPLLSSNLILDVEWRSI